jgi:hypothetical protein
MAHVIGTEIRQARTCYDHLAGVAGAQLLDGLLERGWLVPAESGQKITYAVPSEGESALQARGVDVTRARSRRRKFAVACVDWTERRPHLAGALGAGVLDALFRTGFVDRTDPQSGRSVAVLKPIAAWHGQA